MQAASVALASDELRRRTVSQTQSGTLEGGTWGSCSDKRRQSKATSPDSTGRRQDETSRGEWVLLAQEVPVCGVTSWDKHGSAPEASRPSLFPILGLASTGLHLSFCSPVSFQLLFPWVVFFWQRSIIFNCVVEVDSWVPSVLCLQNMHVNYMLLMWWCMAQYLNR